MRNRPNKEKEGWQNLPALISFYYALIYIAFILILNGEGLIEHSPLSLNTIGDALAGFFAPIGAIWLIASFYQQGEELRLSVKALEDQVAQSEISNERHNVEIQRGLERSLRSDFPKFILQYHGSRNKNDHTYWDTKDNQQYHILVFTNVGGPALSVEASAGYGYFENHETPVDLIKQYESLELEFPLHTSDTYSSNIQIWIEFVDILGVKHRDEFYFQRVIEGGLQNFYVGQSALYD